MPRYMAERMVPSTRRSNLLEPYSVSANKMIAVLVKRKG